MRSINNEVKLKILGYEAHELKSACSEVQFIDSLFIVE